MSRRRAGPARLRSHEGHTGNTKCHCRRDFASWYQEYVQMIRAYVYASTHDPVATDDCTSEIFLKAFARRETFHCRGEGVRPWLVTIARNAVKDYHKSAYKRLEFATEAFTESPDPGPNPEEWVLERANTSAIMHCIGQLNRDQALCIRLRFFEDLSVQQTARAMGRPEGAIRALQYRAVRNLRAILFSAPTMGREVA